MKFSNIYSISAILFLLLVGAYSQLNAAITVIEARNFFYSPSSITIEAGDTIRFQWIAGSHPTGSLSGAWTTFPLDAANPTNDLILTSTGFYPYECVIHAGIGMVGDITVNAGSTPCDPTSAPLNLSAAPSFSNVTVSWDLLINSQLYQVRGRPMGTTNFTKRTTIPNSLTIGGLYPATTYEWQVRALCVGTDEITIWSLMTTFTTMSPKLIEPENLMDVVYREGQLVIRADLPADKYILECYSMSGNLLGQMSLQSDGKLSKYSLALADISSGIYIWNIKNISANTANNNSTGHLYIP